MGSNDSILYKIGWIIIFQRKPFFNVTLLVSTPLETHAVIFFHVDVKSCVNIGFVCFKECLVTQMAIISFQQFMDEFTAQKQYKSIVGVQRTQIAYFLKLPCLLKITGNNYISLKQLQDSLKICLILFVFRVWDQKTGSYRYRYDTIRLSENLAFFWSDPV